MSPLCPQLAVTTPRTGHDPLDGRNTPTSARPSPLKSIPCTTRGRGGRLEAEHGSADRPIFVATVPAPCPSIQRVYPPNVSPVDRATYHAPVFPKKAIES